MDRQKDPDRVRSGRLGALTTHARGHTNVAPARAAWERGLAAEFGITDELDPAERERRVRSALRVRMARLARARWGNRKAPEEIQSPSEAEREGRTSAPTAG